MIMNQSITTTSDGAANNRNDETLVEAHTTQYKGLDEPQISAWLSLVIVVSGNGLSVLQHLEKTRDWLVSVQRMFRAQAENRVSIPTALRLFEPEH